VGEQQAAEPSPAHDVAADQKANEAAFLIYGAFFALSLIFLLASLAKQVSEQKCAQAPASKHAAADQQARETAFLVYISFFAVPRAGKNLFTDVEGHGRSPT